MQLTQEQEKKLKRIAKLVDFETKGAVVLIEDIFALEDEFGAKIPELKELVEELRKERPDRDEIKEIVNEIVGGIKIPEAINGEKGEKGDDYVLTEDDKKEIASLIKVPVVDRIIEKTEVKIEQPIEIIKEVAVITDEAITARGEAIRDGLELLQDDDRLDKKAIKGLDDYDEVARLARQPRGTQYTGITGIKEIVAGSNITIDNTNPQYPVINLEQTFETVSKNLKSYPYTITETSPSVTTIAYTTPTGTITKTITETSATQTDIVISGVGTKTIVETSPSVTTITYA